MNPGIHILWIYLHFHILHSFVLVMAIIFIGQITSYLARNIHPIFQI